MSCSGIYIIANCTNGKKYVGQSYDVDRRIRTHKNKLRKGIHPNEHLQSAWNKYGENSFTFTVAEYCPINELNDREMFWIKQLDSCAPNGYNLTFGGDGTRGYHLSESTKRKLSASAKHSSARYWRGKKLTEEHKEKLRISALNRSGESKEKVREALVRIKADPDIRRKMILHQHNKAVYCVETDTTYYSIGEAARQLGVSSGNISKVCCGRIKTTGGYHFIFVDAPRGTLPK